MSEALLRVTERQRWRTGCASSGCWLSRRRRGTREKATPRWRPWPCIELGFSPACARSTAGTTPAPASLASPTLRCVGEESGCLHDRASALAPDASRC
eukprot:1121887-Rhodomonas_salina.2